MRNTWTERFYYLTHEEFIKALHLSGEIIVDVHTSGDGLEIKTRERNG